MTKPADIEVDQVYVHAKGDRLSVIRIEGDTIFLRDTSGSERQTTREALAKHYYPLGAKK
jgi:hypothetical protein